MFLDQTSKLLVDFFLVEGTSISLIPPVLYLTFVKNKGAAFGLFQNQTVLLIGAFVLALLMVWYYRKQMMKRSNRLKWGVALALAGALGNFIDRLRLGAVIDFIDIRIWPIFNLADIAIICGVALLFWEVLSDGTTSKK